MNNKLEDNAEKAFKENEERNNSETLNSIFGMDPNSMESLTIAKDTIPLIDSIKNFPDHSIIHNDIFNNAINNLGHMEWKIYSYLCYKSWYLNLTWCCTSYGRLSKKCNASRKGCQNSITSLEKKNWIKTISTSKNKGKEYRIYLPTERDILTNDKYKIKDEITNKKEALKWFKNKKGIIYQNIEEKYLSKNQIHYDEIYDRSLIKKIISMYISFTSRNYSKKDAREKIYKNFNNKKAAKIIDGL